MATCPVCHNPAAEVTTPRRVPGASGTNWFVRCPACPIPFEIPGPAMNEAARNPRQHDHRRKQWAEFLRGAADRGERLARLY
jgi:hypothetical protein